MKFLYGYYNEETGQSTVALSNKYNTYIGQAKLHPDDRNYGSKYAGCRLAQKRAWIKYLKEERFRQKSEFKAIQNLIKSIQYINQYESLPKKIKRCFNLKLRDYTTNIKEIEKNIKILQDKIKEEIKARDEILNKGNNK